MPNPPLAVGSIVDESAFDDTPPLAVGSVVDESAFDDKPLPVGTAVDESAFTGHGVSSALADMARLKDMPPVPRTEAYPGEQPPNVFERVGMQQAPWYQRDWNAVKSAASGVGRGITDFAGSAVIGASKIQRTLGPAGLGLIPGPDAASAPAQEQIENDLASGMALKNEEQAKLDAARGAAAQAMAKGGEMVGGVIPTIPMMMAGGPAMLAGFTGQGVLQGASQGENPQGVLGGALVEGLSQGLVGAALPVLQKTGLVSSSMLFGLTSSAQAVASDLTQRYLNGQVQDPEAEWQRAKEAFVQGIIMDAGFKGAGLIAQLGRGGQSQVEPPPQQEQGLEQKVVQATSPEALAAAETPVKAENGPKAPEAANTTPEAVSPPTEAPTAAPAASEAKQGIPVTHMSASPEAFSEFSLDKAGTGEGAKIDNPENVRLNKLGVNVIEKPQEPVVPGEPETDLGRNLYGPLVATEDGQVHQVDATLNLKPDEILQREEPLTLEQVKAAGGLVKEGATGQDLMDAVRRRVGGNVDAERRIYQKLGFKAIAQMAEENDGQTRKFVVFDPKDLKVEQHTFYDENGNVVKSEAAPSKGEAERPVDLATYRLGEGGGGVQASDARPVADAIIRGLGTDTKVKVVDRYEELPLRYGLALKENGYGKGGVQGFFDPQSDTVFVLARNHSDLGQVAETVLHEVVGHKGVEAIFPGNKLDTLWSAVRNAHAGEVAEVADLYGYDPAKPADRRAIISEIIARRAEKMLGEQDRKWAGDRALQRAVAYVRNALRPILQKFGVTLDLTDNDILGILAKGRRALRDNAAISPRDLALKIQAYHGTPAEPFDKFSNEKIGSGEGNQAYGYGHYFAGRKEVAEWYAKQLTDHTPLVYGKGPDGKEYFMTRIGATEWRKHVLEPRIDALLEQRGQAGAKRFIWMPSNDLGSDLAGSLAHGKSLDKARAQAISRLAELAPQQGRYAEPEVKQHVAQAYQATIDALKSFKPEDFRVEKPKRTLLKTTLAPNEEDLLDWDKPLNQQSEKVKAALLSIMPEAEKKHMESWQQPEWSRKQGQIGGRDYGDVVKAGTIYEDLARQLGGPKKVSEALADAGVPGIRYLDAASRNARRYFDFAAPEQREKALALFGPEALARGKQWADVTLDNFNGDLPKTMLDLQESAKKGIGRDGPGIAIQLIENKMLKPNLGTHNYVIFNPEDVNIDEAIRFRRKQEDKAASEEKGAIKPGEMLPLETAGKAAAAYLSKAPEWTEGKKVLGEYLGERQRAAFRSRESVRSILKAVPDKLAREAITNWVEAGGDMKLLAARAQNARPDVKAGYERALKLTPQELAVAKETQAHMQEALQIAQQAGVLSDGVENYINHIYEKDPEGKAKALARFQSSMLVTDPSLAKHRIIPTYFDAERLGLKPKNKDVAYLRAVYDQSLNEAIAARTYIKNMLAGKAKDGRPLAAVSGMGRPLTDAEGATTGYIIKPRSLNPPTAEDGRPYQSVNHPALRKWKWVGKDSEGKPIFMEGDIYIHPDEVNRVKNALGTSWFRSHPAFNNALRLSREFKSTLLSLSGFHQVQEGVHALFHKVNPFNPPPLEMESPEARGLVDHGLMVASHDGLADFGEGLATTGLVNKIPLGVGAMMERYGNYLFTDYIPRLKMAMAKEALRRNTERYAGKLSTDQILEKTANQSNAAFGELNYKMMGRNPTVQDALQLMALAPDFLEARARFLGQALKPGGAEQAAALVRGAIGMQVASMIVNGMVGDKDAWKNWHKPFTVTIHGRDYTLRSVPGDLIHLLTDPRSFVYHRMNPLLLKPIVEALTGRDYLGNARTMYEQAKDLLQGGIPIPLSGIVKHSDRPLMQRMMDSALASIGITSYQHHSTFDREVTRLYMNNMPRGQRTPQEIAEYERRRQILAGLRERTPEGLAALGAAVKSGQITPKQGAALEKRAAKDPLMERYSSLHFTASEPQALEALENGGPSQDELKKAWPILVRKYRALARSNPQAAKEYVPRIQAIAKRLRTDKTGGAK